LTSSPHDINLVRKANSAIVELLDTNTSLPSPARNYIRFLTRTNERLFTRTSILTERIEAATAVLSERKERQSGKRKSIQGKNIMTVEDALSVKQAESATDERKRKRTGNQPKRGTGGKTQSGNDVATANDK